ncbi:MAG: hypothetical protein HFJ54_00725 [Clostridia bacterium]|nr:hypothetical protein [Clostridia bacterium]
MEVNVEWKEKNKRYIKELQIFLDKSESIKDEELKLQIIGQMLRVDKVLTEIAQKEINKNK